MHGGWNVYTRRESKMLTVGTTRTQAFTCSGHSHGLFTSLIYLERGHTLELNAHFSQSLPEEIHFFLNFFWFGGWVIKFVYLFIYL